MNKCKCIICNKELKIGDRVVIPPIYNDESLCCSISCFNQYMRDSNEYIVIMDSEIFNNCSIDDEDLG